MRDVGKRLVAGARETTENARFEHANAVWPTSNAFQRDSRCGRAQGVLAKAFTTNRLESLDDGPSRGHRGPGLPKGGRAVGRGDRRDVHHLVVSILPEVKPQFVAAAAKSDLRTVMVYIDDWENPLWDEYHVDVVPTLVLFEGGKPVYRRDGILGRGLGNHDIEAIVERAAGVAAG